MFLGGTCLRRSTTLVDPLSPNFVCKCKIFRAVHISNGRILFLSRRCAHVIRTLSILKVIYPCRRGRLRPVIRGLLRLGNISRNFMGIIYDGPAPGGRARRGTSVLVLAKAGACGRRCTGNLGMYLTSTEEGRFSGVINVGDVGCTSGVLRGRTTIRGNFSRTVFLGARSRISRKYISGIF